MSNVAQELRELAAAIAELCRASPCHSVAWPIVQGCTDHLCAIAAIREVNMLKPEDIEWSRNRFNMIRDGGSWGVPRSGLVFHRRGNEMVLTAAMPHAAEMPIDAEQLKRQQEGDYRAIKLHFEAAGIPVRRECA
jgi:hypothetical protein